MEEIEAACCPTPIPTHLRSPLIAATTVIKGGTKTNVLANCVKAYVNHRIHPNESIESVIERDKKTINDSRVTVTAFDMEIPPSPVSSITNR